MYIGITHLMLMPHACGRCDRSARHRITFGLNCSNRVFSSQRARTHTQHAPAVCSTPRILQNPKPINYRLTRNTVLTDF